MTKRVDTTTRKVGACSKQVNRYHVQDTEKYVVVHHLFVVLTMDTTMMTIMILMETPMMMRICKEVIERVWFAGV
jgi:hypothetical protein